MLNNSTANIIHESAQRGYYVAISDILDLHLSSTNDLNEVEASVWRHMYRQSRFNPDLSCLQTYEQISNGTRLAKVSAPKVVKRLENKGYLYIKKSDKGMNIYFLNLPEPVLSELKSAPARGEGTQSQVCTSLLTTASTQSLVSQDNKLTFFASEGKNGKPASKELSTGREVENQGGTLSSAKGTLGSMVGVCQPAELGYAPEHTLIINNNKYNKNKINNPSEEIDQLEADTNEEKQLNCANALLEKFNFLKREILQSQPPLKKSPPKAHTIALSKFTSDEQEIICNEFLRQIDNESIEQAKKVGAIGSKNSSASSSSAIKPSTPKAKNLMKISAGGQHFMIENQILSLTEREISQKYNAGEFHPNVMKKTLAQLLDEIKYHVCSWNRKNNSQLEQYKIAVNLCKSGRWTTPSRFNEKEILKREKIAAKRKALEIEQAKSMYIQLAL